MGIDFETVPDLKIKEIEKNDIKIISEKRPGILVPISYSLYEKENLWMQHSPIETGLQSIKQFYSSYDIANGNVLLSGLGFGVLPLWLKNKSNVKNITVVEKNKDIIDIFNDLNNNHEINIIHEDINNYRSKTVYDFVGLDHYENESYTEIIKNSKEILKNINNKSFWIWSLERIYLLSSFDFSNKKHKSYQNLNELDYLFTNKEKIFSKWENFVNYNYKDFDFIKNLHVDKVREYVYTFYSRNNLFEEFKDINRM